MPSRPLGSVERAMVATDRAFGLAAVGVVRLAEAPDAAALRRALGAVQASRPLLRARLTADGDRFVPHDAPLPLAVGARTGDGDALALAERMLGERAPAGPLVRCTYLVGDDGRADLVVAFHHAALDGPAAARVVHDVLTRCAAPATEPPAAPWDPAPPTDGLAPPRVRGARGALRLARFVAREVRADLRYQWRTAPRQRPRPAPDGPTHLLSATLSADRTAALAARARRERATLAGTVEAALLLAVARRRYPPDTPLLRALAFTDARPYLDPPLGADRLGCHVALQRITVANGPDLWPVARAASEALAAANRDGGRFLAARLAPLVVGQTLRTEVRPATVALSHLGALPLAPAYGPTEVLGVHAFVATNRLSPEWSALSHVFRERLRLDVVHLASDVADAEARALARDTLALLDAPDAALAVPARP